MFFRTLERSRCSDWPSLWAKSLCVGHFFLFTPVGEQVQDCLILHVASCQVSCQGGNQ